MSESQFKNGLTTNLMVVSGEETQTSYTASTFSSVETDVIKVMFKDPWRGNFRTAYDPTNLSSNKTGFRLDAFSVDYNKAKHFRVKQIDGKTGRVSAEGIALRWVPGFVDGGGGTLYIKSLFHDSAIPSPFNPENGVIFCNEVEGFKDDADKEFSGNSMWAGSAIRAIYNLNNVYKLTTAEPFDTPTNLIGDLCENTTADLFVGIGMFKPGDRVSLKANAKNIPCSATTTSTGTVISAAIDTNSGKISVFVQFDQPIPNNHPNVVNNPPTGVAGCPGTEPCSILCVANSVGSCTDSCTAYRISNIRLISSPECGTVQKIVFADEVGPDYSPGFELWQWKWEYAGNHTDNGDNHIIAESEKDYKIKGEYINWDPVTKILHVLCPGAIMDIKYGNVYQKTRGDDIIYRGSAIDGTFSKFVRKTGLFINFANTTDTPTYVPGKEFRSGWYPSETQTERGERVVQVTQSGKTSYNSSYEYSVGETVIQPLKADSSGIVTEYAAGRVIAWEPNKTALNTIPSKLVIKRFEIGTEKPEEFESNNPLVTRTKKLAQFRFGPGLQPTVQSGILKRSKRNILPLRIYNQIINTPNSNTDINWYDFSSTFCKQSSLIEANSDPVGVTTISPASLIKAAGSSIGSTRIRAVEQYSGSMFKYYLLDSTISYESPISFADVSHIGISAVAKDLLSTTDGEPILLNYDLIYPIVSVNQSELNGRLVTTLYEPLYDKMIYSLPGGSVFENVTTGSADLGQSEITVQQIYSIDFTRLQAPENTVVMKINENIPNAEFANTFSSSFSFATNQSGKPINLVKYNNLKDADLSDQPSDFSTLYYDTYQSTSAPRVDRLILRRKKPEGVEGVQDLIFGAEVKVKLNDIVKTKTKQAFNQTLKVRYQTEGDLKGKWVAEVNEDSTITDKIYDVDEIMSVFFVVNGEPITENVKSLFSINKQSNDYFYKNTRLILSSDALKVNTNDQVGKGPVFYEVPQIPKFGAFTQDQDGSYYTTIHVSGQGYFIPNSGGVILRESFKDNNNNILSLREVPFYKSSVDGQLYHSSAILDFRPLLDSTKDTVNNTKCVVLPTSSTVNTTLGVYLPRKDLLYITKTGKFKFMYGEPSTVAQYPVLPEPGMVLYRIDKPSYIFSSKDLSLQYTENKRYTMRDIGRIEKRVEQLEVYSTLSLLEKNADSFLVQDTEGNSRFKNGIIVDPFKSHKIGDVSNPDYAIAIDPIESCARPRFTNTNVGLLYNSEIQDSQRTFIHVYNNRIGASTGGISTGLYMLPYSEVPFVVQPQATRAISVTPFDTVQEEGVLRLSPREDDWIDTNTLPELNVNFAGDNDIWEGILDEFNSSETGPFGLQFGNWSELSRQTTTTTQTTPNAITTTSTTSIRETRENTVTELTTSTENVSLGERIVNMSLIPYMRAKRIMAVGLGLKPQARMYPFFDGIEVSQYCYAYSSLQELETAFNTGNLDATKRFSNGIQKTNNSGDIFILFDLPNGVFRTGDRRFSISDNQNNDFSRASSFASAQYSASGLSQVRQNTNAIIRNFDIETLQVSEDRTNVVSTTNTTNIVPPPPPNQGGGNNNDNWNPGQPVVNGTSQCRRIEIVNGAPRLRWVPCPNNQPPSTDPLAQTFEINAQLYPNGVFLSSIDVFFARKPANDTNIPIKVELRPTINGFPDISRVYPGGTCVLYPSQVNVSDFPASAEGNTATRFTFEYPVYLEPGEHSFVIRSTTDEYEVYVAEIGQNLLNSSQRVTVQPYVGVFFMSSNASTWLPKPEMDLMMVMNKCEFPTNTLHTFKVETENLGNELQYELMNLNNSYQEFDNAKISWSMGKTVAATENIVANKNLTYSNTQILLPNEKLYFKASGITTSKDVTPVINKERLSAFFVKNVIDNNSNVESNGELDSYSSQIGSNMRSRYITKIVTLEEGFESTGFKLVLSVNKPIGTKIQAFLKYQTVEQTRNFHDNNYVQLIPKMGSDAFDNYYTQREDQYVDVEFDLPIDSPIEYNKFVIKLCLYSDNPAYIPKVKDLRGIAVL